MFTSSTKRENRQFLVVVVQRRQRNVQKRVMHVQSCCFANLTLLLFFRPQCRRRSRCLNCLIRRARKVAFLLFPFRALHQLSLVSSILPFLLKDVFLYFIRIDDDASEGACVLPAWSVPDVGHGV